MKRVYLFCVIILVVMFSCNSKTITKNDNDNKSIINYNIERHYSLKDQISNKLDITKYSLDSTIDDFDTIRFGFTNDGMPIEWIILDKEDSQALLITKYAFHEYYYHHNNKDDVTWENSYIRNWMNSELINQLFTQEEQNFIRLSYVVNDNVLYGGNNTYDKLFLLSIDECKKYFVSWQRMRTRNFDGDDEWWWLRSPGKYKNYFARVSVFGGVHERGYRAFSAIGVRPAMWVSLE